MPVSYVKSKDLKADDPLAFGAHLDGHGLGIDELDELVGHDKNDDN
jgi:hypothetical protein